MKAQSHNNFWQRIHKSAKDKGFPLRAMFELTYRCNFSCQHCYVPSSYKKRSAKEELKTKEVFSILDQLRDIGCLFLGFTGGEPFIRKDIIDILWHAKRSGFEIIIYTNCSLIDEKAVEELAALKPNKLDITIPAMNETAFEDISGVAGSRNKVFDTIELLHKKGISLGFKTCVLKQNKAEIVRIQNFAKSLGVFHRLDDTLSPRLDGSKWPNRLKRQIKENLFRPEKSNSVSWNLDDCAFDDYENKNGTSKLSSEDLFPCGTGRSQVAITPFGELKMCLLIDYPKYKILEISLKDAWKRLKNLVSSIKPDKNYRCSKCDLQNYCKWCPAKGWLENKSFTACDSESLFRAGLWRDRYVNAYSSADRKE